jgi:hypothetical protein
LGYAPCLSNGKPVWPRRDEKIEVDGDVVERFKNGM